MGNLLMTVGKLFAKMMALLANEIGCGERRFLLACGSNGNGIIQGYDLATKEGHKAIVDTLAPSL